MKIRRRPIFNHHSKLTLLLIGAGLIIYFGTHLQNAYDKSRAPVLVNDSALDTISIPSINFGLAQISYTDLKTQNLTSQDSISSVEHFSDTAMPGEIGNDFMLVPESANLSAVKTDDEIIITRGLRRFTYVVYQIKSVKPTELWVTSQVTDNQRLLTLEGYKFGGQLNDRLAIIARLKD